MARARRAKQEKAEIYWGDEAGIQTGANVEKGYSPKGKTPVLRQTGRKDRINMISAITNQGKVRFMFYKETMNSKRLITFMERLIKYRIADTYITLIVWIPVTSTDMYYLLNSYQE